MNAFEKLKALVSTTEKDAGKFYLKGNKAAGTRLRKSFQQIKALAHDGRAQVLNLKSKEK